MLQYLIKWLASGPAQRPIPQHKVVRKVRPSPTKILLRWLYWIILISIAVLVLVISLEAAMTMYKKLH
ncbi:MULTISPECIES: hypothetical protein [Rheinheimera]|uniref:DUF2474 domain-containing protein n=1 Tax=Rheinheimera marina TaxID=1774958 RepID=A0ABV9JJV6_9GAMM